jgi:glycerol dehydrogenase-like iron-containing ADH family enzyme
MNKTRTQKSSTTSQQTTTQLSPILVAPTQVLKGEGILQQAGNAIATFGNNPLIVGGTRTLELVKPHLQPILDRDRHQIDYNEAAYTPDCCETSLELLREKVQRERIDFIIGVGGGKAMDTAKLLAFQCQLAIVTIPTSAATCAAWTALSNVYSNEGAFQYDVSLDRCPDLLVLDYNLFESAPLRTLIAGIGDAIAKWYEASISSGNSSATLTIAAVQQARILRDLLLQKSASAIANVGSEDWREVVDATVLLAGVIGGLGGANCRTVAAHAIHNGLTHIPDAHRALHGEKVAYGILVQLRLEEMVQGSQLAAAARQQLLKFYSEIGLPKTLEDLGLGNVTLTELRRAADVACLPKSDIHRLPFTVTPEQVMAAMVSTMVSRIVDLDPP